MTKTVTTEMGEVRVHDHEGLKALPVGTRLNSTSGPDDYWELFEDDWYYVFATGHQAGRCFSPDLLFHGGTGRRISRRVLNPEILGEFHPEVTR